MQELSAVGERLSFDTADICTACETGANCKCEVIAALTLGLSGGPLAIWVQGRKQQAGHISCRLQLSAEACNIRQEQLGLKATMC